eukprot:3127749-Pyramimonas_sp.AAC.1
MSSRRSWMPWARASGFLKMTSRLALASHASCPPIRPRACALIRPRGREDDRASRVAVWTEAKRPRGRG